MAKPIVITVDTRAALRKYTTDELVAELLRRHPKQMVAIGVRNSTTVCYEREDRK